METRDLDYILAVAAQGGIGRAAEVLGISQPALTKAVRRVELQAGLPLFERNANGMQPTYAGTRFLDARTASGWNTRMASRRCSASAPGNKGCCVSAIPRRFQDE